MMNNRPNEQLSVTDLLGVISFMIGLANYSENLGQSQFQEELDKAMSDIHKHLQGQDRKIGLILAKLKLEEGGTEK